MYAGVVRAALNAMPSFPLAEPEKRVDPEEPANDRVECLFIAFY